MAPPRNAPRELVPATLTVGLGLASIAGFLGGAAWWLDAFAHFHLHFAAAAVAVAVLAVALRRMRWAALAGMLAAANLLPAAGAVDDAPAPAPQGAVHVASLHLDPHGAAPTAVFERLAERPADVVVLTGVRADWQPLLDELAARYPHRYLAPARTWAGVEQGPVLLSRWPFRRVEAIASDASGRILGLRAAIGGLSLYGVGLLAPWAPAAPAVAEAERVALADIVGGQPGPVAILGDLGTTPYAAAYRRLAARAGVGRAAAGIAASYPTGLGPLGLPLDHLLLGDALDGSFRIEPVPGAAHGMVVGWISVAAGNGGDDEGGGDGESGGGAATASGGGGDPS